jgi:8-oxo-dGTP pyrophosphatase MutT (NUDIX family)
VDAVADALERSGRRGARPLGVEDERAALAAPLGVSAQAMRMAAVLVAVFEEDGQARTILTRRSSTLREHRSEVSFPGGKIDPGEDAVSAARREAHEEIGLDPSDVSVLGWLPAVMTYSSTSVILPVVATLAGRPTMRPNAHEVERAFDVSLVALMAPGVYHEELWAAEELSRPGPAEEWRPILFFEIDGETVWGATARILHELLTTLSVRRADAAEGIGPASPDGIVEVHPGRAGAGD